MLIMPYLDYSNFLIENAIFFSPDVLKSGTEMRELIGLIRKIIYFVAILFLVILIIILVRYDMKKRKSKV